MIEQASTLGESSDYTSNLLGNIRSHLQGLQGFDTMVLELIQNADDAKAKQIVLDVRGDGLLVWNSGTFTYCGELGKKPCPYLTTEGYSCDFHRISDFGSEGKFSRSENIGRFGIGFSSAYQIADHPEIQSAGLKLTLVPEEGKCYRKPDPEENGTTFHLPWATDPRSPGRQALGVSHVTPSHIQQITADCEKVLHHSLLFLRHLEKAELRRNGEVQLTVALDRRDDAELIVSSEPKGKVERWFVVRANAASQTKSIYEKYPQLELLNRKTEVSVAIRVDPEPLEEGLLYAFLPTRQSTGLPFHLNADFFPEDSRKTIIFEGHQHQQAWNDLLVRTAASALADDLEGLRDRLGHMQLWKLLSNALIVAQDNKSRYPECLKSFWASFKAVVAKGAKVGYSAKREYETPSGLLIPKKPLSKQELSAFHRIGGELINENLRPHRNALIQLGSKDLTLERFVAVANESLESVAVGDGGATQDRLDSLYQPLWAIAEELLPAADSPTAQQSVQQLKRLSLVVDTNLANTSIDKCYRSPRNITGSELAISFKFLTFVNDRLVSFQKLYGLVDRFDIRCAAVELEAQLKDGEMDPQELVGRDAEVIRDFYALLGGLDGASENDKDAYATLRTLPIWMTGNGLSSVEHVLLPGDFEDPTGHAKLLDPSCLSTSAKDFIERKLNVKRQTIEEFVWTVVPLFFGGGGPEDIEAYQRLMVSLADHAGLLDNDEIRSLLKETSMVPTNDSWQRADHVYFRTNELAEILGDCSSLWVDEKQLPAARSVHTFIANLGLLNSPVARDLIDRILAVAKASPPDIKARKASEIAFYELCDVFDEHEADTDILADINKLVSIPCLPVDGDTLNWHMPKKVYAPFRYQAFQSQAHILDFKNTQRLKSGLLKALSINTTPETLLVINHLLHCVENGEPASKLVYQVLNERAKQGNDDLSRLRGRPCIYLESQERYVRPNQLYLVPQNLGKYSFSVPEELDQYKDLFSKLGVKREPEPHDYIDIVLDIVEENYPRQALISPEDKAIYQYCMNALVNSGSGNDGISEKDLARLRKAPTILSLIGQLCYPDEVLLNDSDWHAGHFGGELSPMLCKPDPAWWHFLAELGVRRLTRRASVDLEYVDGIEQAEEQIRDKMLERSDVFARMLHDKPVDIRRKLVSMLQNISVLSHDEVRIVASVIIGEVPFSSEPTSVKAFCDKAMEKLILSRPVGERTWLHIFNVILHRLMPEEPAPHIAQVSMNFFQMTGMSVTDAEEFLTEASIPLLESVAEGGSELDLTSAELSDIGEDEGIEVDEQTDLSLGAGGLQSTESGHDTRDETPTEPIVSGQAGSDKTNWQGEGGSSGNRKETFGGDNRRGASGSKKKPRKRDPSKKAWDRKLISYVKQRYKGDEQDRESSELDREYKLSIEVASRAIVCAYERERGRDPEEMAQTHPGYDIVSRRIGDEEVDRYIEVKGTSGEWKQRGVSISRLQFSEAQNHGDKFWLYVVEHALDETCARIHAIQSPAMKVDSFMFDGEWRKVAVDEEADPTLRYKVGTKIDCLNLGEAIIEKVEKRGQTISLLVYFGGDRGEKYMALNLKTMTVIEKDNGPDDP
ncbi:MAG TPA: DUF3883 domain-containing protein [Gammaproteobacteria bacterium]|nr:DUF3883 domain-containing protein [Gammaproteobacteria bacterium]